MIRTWIFFLSDSAHGYPQVVLLDGRHGAIAALPVCHQPGSTCFIQRTGYYYFFVITTFKEGAGNGVSNACTQVSLVTSTLLHVEVLLLIKRYNLYKVLASSTAFFQLSLLCAIFFQLCTFIFLIFSKTSFSQRVLGLPIGLLDMGFHLLIF